MCSTTRFMPMTVTSPLRPTRRCTLLRGVDFLVSGVGGSGGKAFAVAFQVSAEWCLPAAPGVHVRCRSSRRRHGHRLEVRGCRRLLAAGSGTCAGSGGKRSFLPWMVGLYGFPVIGSTPRDLRYSTRAPVRPIRLGLNAAPLSERNFRGTPWRSMAVFTTRMAASDVSPVAMNEASARRGWSSTSWKMATFVPPASSHWVESICQHPLGSG